MKLLYAQLFFDLKQYERRLLSNNELDDRRDNSVVRIALTNKQTDLAKLERGIDRIKDVYVEGDIDKVERKLRMERLEKQIQTKREEVLTLEHTLAVLETGRTDEDRLNSIRKFKEAWNEKGISRKELNTLAKEIIDRIELVREDNEVQVKIRFL